MSRPAPPQYLWQVLFTADHNSIWPWSFAPVACRCYLYDQACEQVDTTQAWTFKC